MGEYDDWIEDEDDVSDVSNVITVIWAVYDADNFECGGIHSLHWSYEGALSVAKELVSKENQYLAASRGDEVPRYPKQMEQQSADRWYWKHRTIEVKRAEVKP